MSNFKDGPKPLTMAILSSFLVLCLHATSAPVSDFGFSEGDISNPSTEPAAPLITKTLPVNHLDTAATAKQLAPLVPPPGSITTVNRQLVIRSTAQNIADIETLLQELDTPPEEITVSVLYRTTRPGNNADDTSRHYQTPQTPGNAPQVRTQTGQPTQIARSHSHNELIPIGWGGFEVQSHVTKGYEIFAMVTLTDNIATVALAAHQYDGDNIQQDAYELYTRVSGPVGQWLALDSNRQTTQQDNNKRYQLPDNGKKLFIKIDRLNKAL
ncbi:hypothetical protein [Gilvimarinus agarilyticus]|uniref:hypothetical protein n=1 Tax=Gilvimarinus agarilyticus TaxID=679259 RepID=UPI00059EE5DE|nr:hypothetical protein [Gilvimarinus agarilyticus]